jgi:hypothetical protein
MDQSLNDGFICELHNIGYKSECPTCAYQKKMPWIDIMGSIQISTDPQTWLDDFIDWLESRGESFGGMTSKEFNPEEDEEDGKE